MAQHCVPNDGSDICPKTQLWCTTPTEATHADSILIRMPHFKMVSDSLRVPLTSLAGAEFVKAWLEVVKTHSVLWSRNIKFGDANLWNAMYDRDLKSGVLIDYDLSVSQLMPRTRTMAFMAFELLLEGLRDRAVGAEQQYEHELEAFIWILLFVSLRCQNGEPLGQGTFNGAWMSYSYRSCYQKRCSVMTSPRLFKMGRICQSDFKDHWGLADWLISWTKLDEDGFSDPVSIWQDFVAQLRGVVEAVPTDLGYINKLVDD